MSYVTWTSDFSVSSDEMDRQHRKLFDFVNEYCDALDAGASHDRLMAAFKKIVDYTVSHFAEEEKLMEASGYDGLGRHKLIHQQLVGRVQDFGERLAGNDPQAPGDFKLFLKNWLTAHIKGIDKQYGPAVSAATETATVA